MDKSQLSKMSNRQKGIIAIVAVVVLIVLWQVIGMFSGGEDIVVSSPTSARPTAKSAAMEAQSDAPKPAQLPQPKVSPQQEAEFTRLQQETQRKYVYTLTELQMLKLSQALAETNKKIIEAKVDTVKAQKEIVDLLTPPPPPTEKVETRDSFSDFQRIIGSQRQPGQPASAPTAANQPPQAGPVIPAPPPEPEPAKYVAISVSQLSGKWNAVVGYEGKLYSVYVGDILSADDSTVIAIDKYGIILERKGVQRKISLVPLI